MPFVPTENTIVFSLGSCAVVRNPPRMGLPARPQHLSRFVLSAASPCSSLSLITLA